MRTTLVPQALCVEVFAVLRLTARTVRTCGSPSGRWNFGDCQQHSGRRWSNCTVLSLPRVMLQEHYRCDPAIIGFYESIRPNSNAGRQCTTPQVHLVRPEMPGYGSLEALEPGERGAASTLYPPLRFDGYPDGIRGWLELAGFRRSSARASVVPTVFPRECQGRS